MTGAIIATGGLGSVIARLLASGGETLRLSSADSESARALAAKIGRAAVVAAGNRDALQGADAVGGDLHDLVVGHAEARSLIGGA
jgi:predicted dinucleotide-binding enzyme